MKIIELFDDKRRQYLADYLAEKGRDVRSGQRPGHIVLCDLDLWLGFMHARWDDTAPTSEITVREFLEHLSWVDLCDPDFDFTILTSSQAGDGQKSIAGVAFQSMPPDLLVFQPNEGEFLNETVNIARQNIGIMRLHELAHEFNEDVRHPDLPKDDGVSVGDLIEFVNLVADPNTEVDLQKVASSIIARMGEIKTPDRAPGMFPCPHNCGGEVNDTMINCYRCGHPLKGELSKNVLPVFERPNVLVKIPSMMSIKALERACAALEDIRVHWSPKAAVGQNRIELVKAVEDDHAFISNALENARQYHANGSRTDEAPVPFPQEFVLAFLRSIKDQYIGADPQEVLELKKHTSELLAKIGDRPVLGMDQVRLLAAAQTIHRLFGNACSYFPLHPDALEALTELHSAITANGGDLLGDVVSVLKTFPSDNNMLAHLVRIAGPANATKYEKAAAMYLLDKVCGIKQLEGPISAPQSTATPQR